MKWLHGRPYCDLCAEQMHKKTRAGTKLWVCGGCNLEIRRELNALKQENQHHLMKCRCGAGFFAFPRPIPVVV